MRISGVLLGAIGTVALLSGAASAQYKRDNWPNWYIALHGDVSFVSDADVEVGNTNIGEISFDSGHAFGAGVGYRPGYSNTFFDQTRFELAYSYLSNSLDSLDSAGTTTALAGDVTGHAFMFNGYYDINTDMRITPYIGAGIGMAHLELDSNGLNTHDTDRVLAYQFMAGLYYSPESIPNTDWGIGYRYFATQDPDFNNTSSIETQHEFDSHSLEFTARFRF